MIFKNRSTRAAAIAAYLIGIVVLPVLHLAFHEGAHDPAGGGIHYHAAAGEPDSPLHAHPHRRVDAGALRRASGPELAAPALAGLGMRAAGFSFRHDADGLAHFGTAPGEDAARQESFDETSLPSAHRDVLRGRFAEFFLESKRAPRPPPAA